MLLRSVIALTIMAILMSLVWLQIKAANSDGYLTVEQLTKRNRKALSFDRHYAMPIDFCILPGFVGLCIFLCGNQWEMGFSALSAGISASTIMFCIFVLWIGGNEAHVHDHVPTPAGLLHGAYATVVMWTIIMVLAFTPQPEPVLLLVMCIIIPAFFFVGTHMFLGMINFQGAASTFPSNPLKDPVGWSMIIGITGTVWARTYFLIPSSFWESLR